MTISQTTFSSANGKNIDLFELKNRVGTIVKITNAGATITSIRAIDQNGDFGEITLGFDDPTFYLSPEYLSNCPYLGTTAGRFANRIARGKFSLDGKEYTLAINNGNNHLHGGPTGFHTKIWESAITGTGDNQKLALSLKSPDMDEGYPGNLFSTVVFFLTDQNELVIEYEATCDKPTPVNLTNHTYFNLQGPGHSILDHEVVIFADGYTEKEDDIPTGIIVPVKDTPYDFLAFHRIGERFKALPANGYDHNFALNLQEGILSRAATAKEPQTGRTLEVFTTMPGMQLYTGYYLDGSYQNGGKKFEQFGGFCMETQYFPDSPNKPNFPDCIATPDKPFRHTTVFKFGTESQG
jgi:aldose 1-epimerase